MTPERWQKIKDVLATALEMSAGEREGYLDRSCGDDLLFRADVERLLDHEPSVNSRFLNETALAETAVAILTPEENLWVGRRVGAYQIAELVGAGGMGEVYRAFRADGSIPQTGRAEADPGGAGFQPGHCAIQE